MLEHDDFGHVVSHSLNPLHPQPKPNMNLKTHPMRLRRLLTGGLLVSLAPGLAAQQTAAGPNQPDPETVVLSEFRVDATQDTGYRATNSVSATLLNTPLRDTPFAIDVDTEDFIRDIGATNFREVLLYDSSSVLDNTVVQGFNLGGFEHGDNISNFDTDVKVRGFPVPTLTNGFRTQVRVDTIALGRIERAGGPSSLLYGIGAISGITNNLTKMPIEGRKATAFSFGFGNHDYYRATVDYSTPVGRQLLGGNMNYRFMGAWGTEGSGLRDFRETETTYGGLVLRWQRGANTEVVVEGAYNRKKESGNGPSDIGYNGPGDTVEQSTGRSIQWFHDIFGQSRTRNLGGPDPYSEYDNFTLRAEVIQKLGKHFTLLVAGQRDDFDQDGLSIANLEAQPNNNRVQWAWERPFTDRTVNQARINLLTRFKALGGSHAIVLGRQEYSEDTRTSQFQPWFRNYPTSSIWTQFNNRPDGTNPLLQYQTLSNLQVIRYDGTPTVPVANDLILRQWISGNYAIYQGSLWKDRITPVVGIRWERSHNLRLAEVRPGFYNNRAQNDQIWPRRNANDPDQGGLILDPLITRGTTVNGYSNNGEPLTNTVPSAALSFRLTDDISLFGQYAEAVNFPSTAQRDGNGDQFPNMEAKNREIGLKFDLFHGKVSGRVSYFELERLNAVRYAWYAPAPFRANFNPNAPVTYFVNAGQAGRVNPDGVTIAPGLYSWDNPAHQAQLVAWHVADRRAGNSGLNDQQAGQANNPSYDRGAYINYDEESTGYELSLDVNVVKGWSSKLSYTYNDVVITRGITGLVDTEFMNGIHAVFQQLGETNFSNGPNLNDPSSFSSTSGIRNSSYDGSVQAGLKKSDTPLHTFNLWNRYNFESGRLKGLSLGLGHRFTSKRVTDIDAGRNDRPNENREQLNDFVGPDLPAFWMHDFSASYSFRWKDRSWDLQLFVRNILDDQKLFAVGLPPSNITRTLPRNAITYLEPRQIRLTASVRF